MSATALRAWTDGVDLGRPYVGTMLLNAPLAHETWFVHDDVGGDWSAVFQTATLGLLAAALIITLVVRFVAARWWSGIEVPTVSRLVEWMPFIMRMHVGISLVGLLSLGAFLAPSMQLAWDVPRVMLGAAVLVIAVLLLAGWRTRPVAWALILLGPVAMLQYGSLDIVQRVDLLGCAGFLACTGAGRWSVDDEQGHVRAIDPLTLAQAAWVLRVAVGVCLIVVAFNEKLAQPDLAIKFLAEYPQFNVLRELGFGTTDLQFTRIAGATEVFFGLMLISGAMPQVGVVAIGIPFNLTLFFFGDVELLGHLPIYGTMVVILILGCSGPTRRLLSLAWPTRRAVQRAAFDTKSVPVAARRAPSVVAEGQAA